MCSQFNFILKNFQTSTTLGGVFDQVCFVAVIQNEFNFLKIKKQQQQQKIELAQNIYSITRFHIIVYSQKY